ncbi:MAG: hypothetical protein H0V76_03035 [Blastocatellia bacterium]|nr:hypothetical protein [Blastocatellia bacterium]
MNRYFKPAVLTLLLFVFGAVGADAQRFDRYQGTAVAFGVGPRAQMVSRNFDLRLERRTSEAEVARYRDILRDQGHDALWRELSGNDLGTVGFGGRLGPRVVAAIDRTEGTQQRLMVIFERWLGFGEFRAGARSLDYPFGVLEMVFDSPNASGDGTFIGAARIRLGRDRATNEEQIELESFGTFPGRLMGVRQIERRAL